MFNEIARNENFIVKYDKERHMYQAAYRVEKQILADIFFDAYEEPPYKESYEQN